MKFAKLYHDNHESVERALAAMWCGEAGNASQAEYAKKLQEEINNVFAPDDAMPVVQCMNSYEAVHSVSSEEAKALVGGLWKATKYAPYEHQYQCWKTLLKGKTADGLPMSVCVTTGTGSGKTECFMMPLVKDLVDNGKQDQVQALFLYPLNALMEDQKQRLEELLDGTNLTYTVFNGDLPEQEPAADDHSTNAEHTRKRIQQIRGWDEKTKDYRFKHLLYTRAQVRKNPPNILLTNPTMLEYILLRAKDAVLTNPALKSLRWVAIDETHTYTGAGAAELAMLLRRVLLAFGVSASNVRFATSSATFGNGANPEEEMKQLQKFIGGITGLRTDQVNVVGGKRIGEDFIPDNADGKKWRMLFNREYVPLNEMITDGKTIEDKLALLDELCDRVPMNDGIPMLKAKVHYFYRVPNNGLYVRLTEHENGAFKLYTMNNAKEDEKNDPLLELSRCKHCGEYVALAQINNQPGDDFGKYKAVEREDSDMFDLADESDEEQQQPLAIIGLSDKDNENGDNNVSMEVMDGKLLSSVSRQTLNGDWHLVVNTKCRCPHCNSKLTKRRNSDEDLDKDMEETADSAYLMKFRTSPEFISRLMAPSVLDNLDKVNTEDGEKIVLHDGQQYISFADSRQMAAKATMKQNLEQERDWVYSRIFHELCRRAERLKKVDAEIAKLQAELPNCATDVTKLVEIAGKIQKLQKSKKPYLTWMEIANLLKNDTLSKVFCVQFVKRSGDSEELDMNGNIRNEVMDKYIQSIMVMYLSSRPVSAAAPETLGLFCSCYPQTERIELPMAVERFNANIHNEENKISKEDWHHLIQIFMDYTVRSNQSLYLKIADTNPIDIFACERFATEKPRRRPVKKPFLDPKKMSNARTVRFITELLKQDKGGNATEAYRENFGIINDVLEALWEDVTREGSELLQLSQSWDKDAQCYVTDKQKDGNPPYRLNLKNLCFKLYDDVYLCDTNTDSSLHHTVCLRPIENHFKNFAPYLGGNKVCSLKEEWHEKWTVFPTEAHLSKEEVRAWAKDNRKILWNNHIWGENGVFENRLTDIYAMPNLFIQAEHTAQVDKDVSRTLQLDFKEHTINILACSTTMEMGVDLGNLEVVMLTSVPPMPSNYKQRAGRSGRNNKVKSACITLCGSDAIGLRTLFAPIPTIISRPVCVPMVDLMSPQVVQRHVNSYLIRSFGVFKDGDCGGRLTQAVYNYYSNFIGRKDGNHAIVVRPEDNAECSPNDKLGEQAGSMYEVFNQKCMNALDDNIREGLEQLLRGTVYDGMVPEAVDNALKENKRCYKELNQKLEDLKFAFKDATNDKFRTLLKMQYYEVLLERLLNFWATHRFTPNANMPVEVLSLDLNSLGSSAAYRTTLSSNPSYGLREAIAQYAPGNSIVVDGVVYAVRGVQFANMYQGARSFKQIYRNSEKCVINDSTSLDKKQRWSVNGKEGLELVQPVGFVPDMNEDKSRVIDNNRYTHVNAQLIGTADWADLVTEPHLFSVRSNRDSGYANILYYNEGIGYGYCMCAKCGRTVLENDVADPDDTLGSLPYDMNTRMHKKKNPDDPDKPLYHFAVSGKDARKYCVGSHDATSIRRNVIIGGLIQTDFSEIRIRHKGQKKWMNSRAEDNLLFTLGIVLTQALLDTLGKERGAVDFTVMPNGHLCLFDTNPGGAGYSNQLANIPLMKDVINAAKTMLLEAKSRNSKDFLLNKFTLRYIDQVDIDAALNWIKEEEEARGVLPTEVAAVSAEASETSNVSMAEAYGNEVQETVFFVRDNFEKWNYEGDHGWRTHFFNKLGIKDKKTTLCVLRNNDSSIPEPCVNMLRSVKEGWAKSVVEMSMATLNKSIYPIAYIGKTLYFTNNAENANLNDAWSNQTLYCARVDNICQGAAPVDLAYKPDTKIVILDDATTELIKTNDLFSILRNSSDGIVDKFISHCKQHGKPLTISYQDEHLKSVMGMVLTLQTIGGFVKEIGQDFTLKYLMEMYSDPNYRGTITANLQDNAQRDTILTDLTEGWLNDLKNDNDLNGTLVPIHSQQYNKLPHWRVLIMECAGKRLCIYPDGGFANGWDLLRDWTVNSKRFTIENTDTRDVIVLKRRQDIKFDISLQDC